MSLTDLRQVRSIVKKIELGYRLPAPEQSKRSVPTILLPRSPVYRVWAEARPSMWIS